MATFKNTPFYFLFQSTRTVGDQALHCNRYRQDLKVMLLHIISLALLELDAEWMNRDINVRITGHISVGRLRAGLRTHNNNFNKCVCIVVPHCPVGGAEHAVGIESKPPSRPSLTKTVCISGPAQQVPGDITLADVHTRTHTHARALQFCYQCRSIMTVKTHLTTQNVFDVNEP